MRIAKKAENQYVGWVFAKPLEQRIKIFRNAEISMRLQIIYENRNKNKFNFLNLLKKEDKHETIRQINSGGGKLLEEYIRHKHGQEKVRKRRFGVERNKIEESRGLRGFSEFEKHHLN